MTRHTAAGVNREGFFDLFAELEVTLRPRQLAASKARLFVEHALAIVKASPGLRSQLVSETADALEFRGGKVLAAFPCSSRSARGWAISCLVLDEFAHFLDLSEGPGGRVACLAGDDAERGAVRRVGGRSSSSAHRMAREPACEAPSLGGHAAASAE